MKGKASMVGFANVCTKGECKALMDLSCEKVKACGHNCKGFRGEKKCLPCLHEDCAAQSKLENLPDVNDDSYCTICNTSGMGSEPCVLLECRHVYHLNCLLKNLNKKSVTPRIVFNFLNCP